MNAITQTTPVPANDTGSMFNFIAQALKDPSIDVTKLDALLRMQREIVADERKLAFYCAMSAVQSDVRPVLRDAANTTTNSRYATFEGLDRVIRPIYTKHGFLVMCDSEPIPGGVRIWCEVAHSGGHSKIINAEAPLDLAGPKGNANKTPIHGWKSAISYLRRATLEMAFNLATTGEDDDGNAAGHNAVLTPKQVEELWALMKDTDTKEGKFLSVMCPDLRSITQAPANDFGRLRTALLDKRTILARRAAQRTTGDAA